MGRLWTLKIKVIFLYQFTMWDDRWNNVTSKTCHEVYLMTTFVKKPELLSSNTMMSTKSNDRWILLVDFKSGYWTKTWTKVFVRVLAMTWPQITPSGWLSRGNVYRYKIGTSDHQFYQHILIRMTEQCRYAVRFYFSNSPSSQNYVFLVIT